MDVDFTLLKILNQVLKLLDYVGNIITKKQTEESDKFDNNKPIYLFNLNS